MREIDKILLPDKPVWWMSIQERAMVVGIAAILQPDIILEVGIYKGGCTHQLAKMAKRVICIDPVNNLDMPLPANCTYLQTTSDVYFEQHKNETYDLIVVDADHSTESAYKDLMNSIQCGRVVLMHDTMNDTCRAGYQQAIDSAVLRYSNLEMVHGNVHDGVMWGGIGLCIR